MDGFERLTIALALRLQRGSHKGRVFFIAQTNDADVTGAFGNQRRGGDHRGAIEELSQVPFKMLCRWAGTWTKKIPQQDLLH